MTEATDALRSAEQSARQIIAKGEAEARSAAAVIADRAAAEAAKIIAAHEVAVRAEELATWKANLEASTALMSADISFIKANGTPEQIAELRQAFGVHP